MHVASRGAPRNRFASPQIRAALGRRAAEAGGIALLLAAAAMLAALLSYNPADPSPDTATAAAATNLAGPVGAAFADVALQFFGLAGFLPVVVLLAWAWRIASRGGLGNLPLRVTALLFALPAAAAVLGGAAILLGGLPGLPPAARAFLLPGPDSTALLGAGPGGAIGLMLSRAALDAGSAALGTAGAVILWIVLLILATALGTLSLGLSRREWQAMVGGTGAALRFLFRRHRRPGGAFRAAPFDPYAVEDDPDHVGPGASPLAARRGRPGAMLAVPDGHGAGLPAEPTAGSGARATRRRAERPAGRTAERREPALRGTRNRTAEPAEPPRMIGSGWMQPPGAVGPVDDGPPPPPRPRPNRAGRPPRPAEPPIALGGPADVAAGVPDGFAGAGTVPADATARSRSGAERPEPDAAPAPPRAGGMLSISRLLGGRPAADPARRTEERALPAEPRPRPPRIEEPDPWQFPPLALLKAAPPRASTGPSAEVQQENARLLETVLSDYGVQGAIGDIHVGPVVTLYELEPAPGIRSARVIGLADDVARSLSVTAVRIATVPGRNVIGIEVPNSRRETVFFSELLDADPWYDNQARLCLALGKDISGAPIYADLARMPHLLIAGTTGSGKSVGINSMILSLLYRLSPDECRLIMIDPKMLELSIYDGIPHLMAPVVTEPAKAVTALKWTVREMERRYRGMSQLGVRNIGGYNERVAAARASGERMSRQVQTGFDPETNKPIFEEQVLSLEKLPYIVVVIDEMADLMMVAGKEIEAAVQRLAQMARAAGIHVIMATQRPSVDVITGTIKANFPTRISFQVISKFDSRTILGEQGAEQLLGQGDMLYMAGGGRITRVHGPFVADSEVEEVVRHLRAQGEPDYVDEVTALFEDEAPSGGKGGGGGNGMGGDGGYDGETALFDQAVALVTREGKASTSFIQRHLSIGYNRAAKLIEQMEKEGVVSPANHVGRREVLARRHEPGDE